jgi:hypothetical protein
LCRILRESELASCSPIREEMVKTMHVEHVQGGAYN